MNAQNEDGQKEPEIERDNGDRAPEDMVECEFWDDTNSQKDGDPVRGLRDFQGTGHWSADTDDDCSSSEDEEEEEESSDTICNSEEEESSHSNYNLSGEEEG